MQYGVSSIEVKMEYGKKVWMDGTFVDFDQAKVSVLTHSLHYGLGVFEGIRSYKTEEGSAVFRLKCHMQRFIDSARICMIECPYTVDELCNAVVETLRENGFEEAYIRPLLILGNGSMGLYAKDNPVKVSISAWTWGTYLGDDGLKNGIKVRISSFVRWHSNTSLTKAKLTGNYIISQLAKRDALADGYDEALLLDTDGYVAEGPGENIFLIKDGAAKTTPGGTILCGITRDTIMKIMEREGIACCEERFTRDELYLADEAFFTGTAAEVTPIREVDRRQIGSGKPGPITKKVQDIYFDIVHGRRAEYSDWLTKI